MFRKTAFFAILFVTFYHTSDSFAQTKDYQVEVIFFRHVEPQTTYESFTYEPAKIVNPQAETWVVDPSLLVAEHDKLQDSTDTEVLYYYAWGQHALPYETAAVMNFYEQEIRGSVKVYADHLLFANIDIELDGYRLSEKRRLRLNEKHYFDHPRFGVLLQVSRLESFKQEQDSTQNETP